MGKTAKSQKSAAGSREKTGRKHLTDREVWGLWNIWTESPVKDWDRQIAEGPPSSSRYDVG